MSDKNPRQILNDRLSKFYKRKNKNTPNRYQESSIIPLQKNGDKYKDFMANKDIETILQQINEAGTYNKATETKLNGLTEQLIEKIADAGLFVVGFDRTTGIIGQDDTPDAKDSKDKPALLGPPSQEVEDSAFLPFQEQPEQKVQITQQDDDDAKDSKVDAKGSASIFLSTALKARRIRRAEQQKLKTQETELEKYKKLILDMKSNIELQQKLEKENLEKQKDFYTKTLNLEKSSNIAKLDPKTVAKQQLEYKAKYDTDIKQQARALNEEKENAIRLEKLTSAVKLIRRSQKITAAKKRQLEKKEQEIKKLEERMDEQKKQQEFRESQISQMFNAFDVVDIVDENDAKIEDERQTQEILLKTLLDSNLRNNQQINDLSQRLVQQAEEKYALESKSITGRIKSALLSVPVAVLLSAAGRLTSKGQNDLLAITGGTIYGLVSFLKNSYSDKEINNAIKDSKEPEKPARQSEKQREGREVKTPQPPEPRAPVAPEPRTPVAPEPRAPVAPEPRAPEAVPNRNIVVNMASGLAGGVAGLAVTGPRNRSTIYQQIISALGYDIKNMQPGEMHIPDYVFTGPGTDVKTRLNQAPANVLDAYSLQHDLLYTMARDSNDIISADRIYIRNLEKMDKSSLVNGILLAMRLKTKAEGTLGRQIYPPDAELQNNQVLTDLERRNYNRIIDAIDVNPQEFINSRMQQGQQQLEEPQSAEPQSAEPQSAEPLQGQQGQQQQQQPAEQQSAQPQSAEPLQGQQGQLQPLESDIKTTRTNTRIMESKSKTKSSAIREAPVIYAPPPPPPPVKMGKDAPDFIPNSAGYTQSNFVGDELQRGVGILKPKFIIPSVNILSRSEQESYVDDLEFAMFDFVQDEGGNDPNGTNPLMRDQTITTSLRYQNSGVTINSLYGENLPDNPYDFKQERVKELFMGENRLPKMKFLYSDEFNAQEFNLSEFEVDQYDVNNERTAIQMFSPYAEFTNNQLLDQFIDTSVLYGIVP